MQWKQWSDVHFSSVIWIFVAGVLFGLYLASFVHCVRWLLFEDEGWTVRRKINRTLVITTLLIFFLSMPWFWMEMTNIFWPPIYSDSSIPMEWALTIFLSDGFNWSILIVIDSVLIYRCWTVFGKNWFIICFPLVLWSYCLFGAISAFYCDLTPLFQEWPWQTGSFPALYNYCSTWGVIFYVCNTMIGIYTMSTIVYKIWHAAKNRNGTNRLLYRTRRILTESGILYTVSSASNLAWRAITLQSYYDNARQYLDYEIQLLQVVGQVVEPIIVFMPIIAFNLITIRVGEQRARGQDSWVDSMSANLRSELLNNLDTPNAAGGMEPTDLGQERHGRIGDEGELMEVHRTGDEEIMEVDRSLERQ